MALSLFLLIPLFGLSLLGSFVCLMSGSLARSFLSVSECVVLLLQQYYVQAQSVHVCVCGHLAHVMIIIRWKFYYYTSNKFPSMHSSSDSSVVHKPYLPLLLSFCVGVFLVCFWKETNSIHTPSSDRNRHIRAISVRMISIRVISVES